MRSRFLAPLVAVLFCVIPKTGVAQGWEALIATPDAIEKTAELLGLIESIDRKVDRLLDGDFKTGYDLLDQANKANPEEKKHLFRESRTAFTKAANLAGETQDGKQLLRRGLSRLGIWHCCLALDDKENAKDALEKIIQIPTNPTFWNGSLGIVIENPATTIGYVSGGGGLVSVIGRIIDKVREVRSGESAIERTEMALGDADPERLEFLKLQAIVAGIMMGKPIVGELPDDEAMAQVATRQAQLLAHFITLSRDAIRDEKGDKAQITKIVQFEIRNDDSKLSAEFEVPVGSSTARKTWEFTFSPDFEKIEESKELP